MLLDITHEEVETRTHRIIHIEHHVEVQDAELQVQAPPKPIDLEEIDAISGVDED
jgi:uncharacterized protein (UPF0218 family)